MRIMAHYMYTCQIFNLGMLNIEFEYKMLTK